MKVFKLALIALLTLNTQPSKAISLKMCAAISGFYATGIVSYAYFKYLPKKRNFDLYNAIYDGNIIKINKLIKEGADVNAIDTYGRTPLYLAATCEFNADVIKALINAGANVNATNNAGQTPLLVAARNRSLDVIKALIDAGADVNATDNAGKTPLHYAACCNNADVIKILINAGADVNAKNNAGQIPLHIAANYRNLDAIKALICAGADANVKVKFKDSTKTIGLKEILSLYSRSINIGETIDLSNKLQNDFIFKLAKLPNQKIIQLIESLGKDQFLMLLNNINAIASKRLTSLAIYCMLKNNTLAEYANFNLTGKDKIDMFTAKFGYITKVAVLHIAKETGQETALKIYEDLITNKILEDTLC